MRSAGRILLEKLITVKGVSRVTMQVISIDTLLQVGQGGDQSKAALPPKYHACFPESDALMHIEDRQGFSSPENEWEEDTLSCHHGLAWTNESLAEGQFPVVGLLVGMYLQTGDFRLDNSDRMCKIGNVPIPSLL